VKSQDTEVTFFTISDRGYFLGTVALLNSLRLSGNEGPLMVLDLGLTASQRDRLGQHARIVTMPGEHSRPWMLKAYPRFFDPQGVVVIIDSDMIVTHSLRYVVDKVLAGKICVFPDHFSQWNRSFTEWETDLQLKRPLRRQTYVNAGFIALSTKRWPDFLPRFEEVLERIPAESLHSGAEMTDPFWGADQDALNALLMSEVRPDEVEILAAEHEVHPDALQRTTIIDLGTLECRVDGIRPAILHYGMQPKAWDRIGWLRIRRDAYVRLFSRVVCGEDVSLRVPSQQLPMWLRPSIGGKITLASLDAAHSMISTVRRRLSPRGSAAVLGAKQRLMELFRRRPHGPSRVDENP
jgi:hypothetical protein